ncbi:MAG: DUF4065 domain-containing protein [Synergistaceae bacterium]|nr:DUF4065 domain-containing protein [Synergistaceae bacterium]
MANVFDTAKYILETHGKISAMKLQKLCYYCQAWSLVWDDEPLFPENFEAWVSGPVCKELYDVTKDIFKVHAYDIHGNPDNLSDNQKNNINIVLEHYSQRNSQWSCDLSRMEEPFILARKGLAPHELCHNIISLADMAEYYCAL